MLDAAFNGADVLFILTAIALLIANHLYEKGADDGRDR